MKPEIELLRECIDSGRLSDTNRETFEHFLESLESGKYRALTAGKREWVLKMHAAFGLDPGAANLISSGRVKPAQSERDAVKVMLASLGPKPLKPPGRR